ncbi:type II toxin-antitoxin system VapC family toxin [Rhizobium sp. LjRoot254]|uniref:type II toxin-antitoxin system VapC family toxin n=1 Tax=Rhizobium sp. LjRoot254 TaxID=3342297 RepID=UPI003ECF3F81
MYVLDTNVISELRKKDLGKAALPVVKWADSAPPETRYISSITIMEIEMGILSLERRTNQQSDNLRNWLRNQVLVAFRDRILPVDEGVALRCAQIMTPRTRPLRDALIAATAQHHGYTVVTRNVKDFIELPVRLLNPWEA